MGARDEATHDTDVAPRRLRLGPRHLQYAIPYSIVVSVLYLLGYWGTFQVDPLEYVGIGDVVKLAIYPLFTVLVIGAAVVGAAHVAIILLGKSVESVERGFDVLIANCSKRTAALMRLGWLLVSFALMILGLYSTADVTPPSMPSAPNLTVWHFVLALAIWVCGWIAIQVGSDPVLSSFIGSRMMAMLSIFFVVAPFVCAFPAGRVFAQDRLDDGCVPIEIDTLRSSAFPPTMRNGTYLGYLGGHVFVREWKTGAVAITRLSEGQSLVLLPLDTRAGGRPRACSRSRRGSGEMPAPTTPAD